MSDQSSSSHALLDFIGNRLDPQRLIPLFPIRPWKAIKMGDQMGRPSASGVIARARTGYCSFSTRGLEASPNINQHIGLLLSFIGDRTEAIKNVIREDNLECKIVCFFGSQAQRQNWTINAENELVAQSFGIAVVRETVTTNIEIDIDRTSPG